MCRNLFRHRGLLWQFVLRNLELRHRGSLLGLTWAVLNPLLMLGLYVWVFGYIFDGTFGVIPGETRWDYGLGIFLGLSVFHFMSEAIASAPLLIINNPNFVKKVVFPLEILPAAAIGAAIVHMMISAAMVISGAAFSTHGLGLQVFLLPVVLLPIILIGAGCSWLLAALGVFFRDIGQIVGALVAGLMFASAVFYPMSDIQEMPVAWAFLRFNPLLHVIEMARNVVLWDRPVDVFSLLVLYGVGGAAALFGYACFARLKPAFADVI